MDNAEAWGTASCDVRMACALSETREGCRSLGAVVHDRAQNGACRAWEPMPRLRAPCVTCRDAWADLRRRRNCFLLAGRIPLSDLALDDPSARPGAAKSPPSGGGRPPISYIHIYEDKHISLGIFCMPRHALIPLHNHPGMTVFSRVLYGKVHILSFDWADQAGTGAVDGPEGARSDSSVQGRTSDSSACRSEAASEARHACQNGFADREATSTSGGASCVDPGASPRRGWARRVWDRSFSGEDAPVLLRPTAGGNIHQFTAMGDCAVLDLLTPPYCPDVGRDCTYFRALGGVEGCGPGCVGDEVLLETHLPQDESAILDVAYQGKPVLARPLQLIAEEYRTVLEVARRAEQG
ncbi:DUF1637 hypothetical protein [Helicosporidium sp. ATCC 50920]|nr:DUF1637 hypothetical protein [Helicosporidium sp. ATCC 50920]|eukprot:KDD74597.1 DUF1637 hypothetical protein [Helicosporidium sp. ATCC 50920]